MDSDDRKEKHLILKHILRREHILKVAAEHKGQLRCFLPYPPMRVLFEEACEYYENFGGLPPKDVMMLNLGPAAEYAELSDPDKEYMTAMVNAFYAEVSFADKYVQDLVLDDIKGAAAGILHQHIGMAEDSQEVHKQLKAATKTFDYDPFGEVQEENPFDDIDGNMKDAVRRELGVGFLDHILDGGPAKGESVGILAPSGGGKTILAMQMSSAQVLSHEHVAHLSTEQRLRGDLAIRTFCLASKRPRGDFAGGPSKLDPEIRRTLHKVGKQWKEYYHFFDYSNKQVASLEQVFTPIRRLADQGKMPSLIILDWWGRLRDNLISNMIVDNEAQIRREARGWLHALKQFAEDYGTTVVVLHQLAGAVAGKSSSHIPSSHSAQEDTNFNNMFDWCFTLSKKNSDNIVYITADKARGAANPKAKVEMVGEYCMFRWAENMDTGSGMVEEEPESAPSTTGVAQGPNLDFAYNPNEE